MIFKEENLTFDFNEIHWKNLIQYDQTKTFQNLENAKIGSGTKGVDLVGIYNNKNLFLIEIKDFRVKKDGGIPNPKEKDLKNIIAQKVRDSLAGIIGGAKNSTNHSQKFESYLPFFEGQKKTIQIIFWMEQEFEIWNKDEERFWRSVLLKDLKLKWLTSKILILNAKNNPFDSIEVNFS